MLGYTPIHAMERIKLWHQLQTEARLEFERIIDANPDVYGIAPTRSQIREARRKRCGTKRPPRGSKRRKG